MVAVVALVPQQGMETGVKVCRAGGLGVAGADGVGITLCVCLVLKIILYATRRGIIEAMDSANCSPPRLEGFRGWEMKMSKQVEQYTVGQG